MKKNKLLNEEDVKKQLCITDFRTISKDKIIEFVSLLPKMDKEEALAVINQFPNYSDMSKEIVNQMTEVCNKAILSDEVTHKEVIEGYKLVLLTLQEELKNDELTPNQKEKINNQMIEIINGMSAKDSERKKLITTVVETGGKFFAGVIIAGVAILGGIYYSDKK